MGRGIQLGQQAQALSNYATLDAAITAIGATETYLILNRDETISTGGTSPVTLHLHPINGSILTIPNGQTLTINGPFIAGDFQVFSEVGTGKVAFGPLSNVRPNPLWWGLQRIPEFADGETAPSVRQSCIYKTANTAPTLIASLPDGLVGQEITIIVNDAFTTFDFTGTNLIENGIDYTAHVGDIIYAANDGTNWVCSLSSTGSNNSYGEAYVSSPAATAITTHGTYYKINGTYTSGQLNGFTHSSGRLTYTGTTIRMFHIQCCISATASNNEIYFFRIAKGGTTIESTQIGRKTSTTDLGAIACNGLVQLATNEYIELFVTSDDTNTTTMTATLCTIIITEV